jgi:DNA-binding NtrC family response regulator
MIQTIAQQNATMNILFVENHQIFAKFVTGKFLNQHQVTIVPKIADAWAILSKEQIDIVLVDFDLDDGKGDKLVEKIKAHHLNVKMVAVSSHNSGNMALQKAGADAICGKFEFSRIGAVIEQLLQ